MPRGRRDDDLPQPRLALKTLDAASSSEPREACIYVTIWMWAYFWLGVIAYAVAWTWGGRVERFAAAVMLVQCVITTMNFILTQETGSYLSGKIINWIFLLIMGWLCFRSDRWWPLLLTATMALKAFADLVGLFNPGISDSGLASAKIGVGYLIDLTLMLSVVERWLAGEEPVGRAAWARADAATAARRNWKKGARRPAAMPPHEPAQVSLT